MTTQSEYHYHGKPCIKCGSTLRYKRSKRCVDCLKSGVGRWNQKNRDKKRAQNKRWYQANQDYFIKKYQKNKGKMQKYYLENPGASAAASKKYREKHPDYANSILKWQEKNQIKVMATRAVNEEIRKGNMPKAKDLRCIDSGPYCRGQAFHYHHESYDEKHWLDVVPLCQSCHKRRHQNKPNGR